MEREGGDIHGLLEEIVAEVIIAAALTYVWRHAYGMEDEVELAAEVLEAGIHEMLQVLDRSCVGRNEKAARLFGKLVESSESEREGGVGEYQFGAFLIGLFGHFPGNGLLVHRAGDYSLLAFQQIVSHIFEF